MKPLSFSKVFGTAILVIALLLVFFQFVPNLISSPDNGSLLLGALILVGLGVGIVVYAYNAILKRQNKNN